MFILTGWSQAKGSAEHRTISHESTTAVNGDGEPLMLIGCQGMHALYALVKRRNAFIQNAESAIGSINMQPESLLSTQVGKLIQWINRPGLHSSGGCRNTERPQPCRTICQYLLTQAIDVHLQGMGRGNKMNGITAQPHRLYRFSYAEMALIRLVEDKGMMYPLYAFGPYIPSINLRSPLASGLQAGEIGFGTAADKDACASLYRKPTQFHDPLNRAPL